MPAGKPPKGEKSPEKHGVQKDVKETQAPSESVTTEAKTSEVEAKADTNQEVTDEILEALEDQKKVPYNRFKEVNEKAKTLEQRLKDMESRSQSEMQRAVEDAEIRVHERLKKEHQKASELDVLDPYEHSSREIRSEIDTLSSELSSLKVQTAERRLQDVMSRLQSQYPEADQEAVLGWKRALPRASIDELMERSHNRNIERVETKFKELVEKKKQRAQSALPTGEGGIRLKESERPKSLKDAHKAMKRYFGG